MKIHLASFLIMYARVGLSLTVTASVLQHSILLPAFSPSLHPFPLLLPLSVFLYVSVPVLSLSPLPYSLYPLEYPYIVAFCQFLLKIKGSTIPPSPVSNTVLILFRRNHLHLLQKFRKLCYTLSYCSQEHTHIDTLHCTDISIISKNDCFPERKHIIFSFIQINK